MATNFYRLFLVFFLTALSQSYAMSYEADIEYIHARNYFETALREITQAQKSIKMFMFVIAANPVEPQSKVMQLLSALVDAKSRGVSVEVHLDQNYPYGSEREEVEEKNENAYRFLKQNGMTVYFDDPTNYAHAKAIVIDDKITIFGSSNLSKSALDINDETNAIVRSEKFAKEVLEDLSRVENFVPDLPEEVKSIKIPTVFTTHEKFMPKMTHEADQRAYDTYLYLLKILDENADRKITLDYDDLAKSLGISSMTRTDYRRQISKVLRKLEKDYGIITAGIAFNEPAQVVLKELEGEGSILFPETYWSYGWPKTLSLAAKVMLLLNWQYSPSLHSWRKSVRELVKTHGLSGSFIGDGVMELRKLNLIDVRYEDVRSKDSEGPKWRAIYTPNLIYNPEELKKQFDTLAEKHGQEAVDRAKIYARVVFKDNDYEDVLTLIGLENQYGQEILKEAAAILEAKDVTNPKRNFGYLSGTIKSLAKEKAAKSQ